MTDVDLQRALNKHPAAHTGAEEFARRLPEPIQRGVLTALAMVEPHKVPIVWLGSSSPWVYVDQLPGTQYVVWMETGEVFPVKDDGTVGEKIA